MTNSNPHRKIIAITGGPGGGKTILIDELCKNPLYKNKFVPLPEALFYVLQTKTLPKEKLYQRVMVEVQSSMENAIDICFEPDKIILCDRGTLDPLAYWLNNGWELNDFFSYTKTSIEEHFSRYYAVIHLQTAAVKAVNDYLFYPDAHRHENPDQSEHLDSLLACVWKEHPKYFFIESNMDWEIKKDLFYQIISNNIF